MPCFRQRFRPLLALLLLAAGAPGAEAGLRFEEPAARLGEVRAGVPLAHEFHFVNDGPDTVELLEARPGCGCLRPTLTQRLVPPGEQGTVRLEVNTLTQAVGPHNWKLNLLYRRGAVVESAELAVSAHVVAELTVQPASLTFFTEGPLSQEVVLTDLRAQPLQDVAVRTSAAGLTATLRERTADPAGHPVFRIRLDVSADCPEGRHEEVLDVYTADPVYRHLRLPVTVVRQARRRLTAVPAEVTVRAGPGQPVPSQLIRVRDARGEPVVIEAVTADDPVVSCRWAGGDDGTATVRVQFDGARLSGAGLRCRLQIRVSMPAPQTLTVPLSCTLE
jgi:hypothetical protein